MLTLSKLTLGYAGKPVLQFKGAQLQQGEQCLITGASGSGKTTLLYAIAGMIPVMEGHITLGDTDVANLSESARDRFRGQHIGMIFQTLHLVKSLSVMDNLLLASYVASLPQKREHAREMLARLGIEHKQNDLPETLSQGQAQRVAIARAILHAPKLILADEPTSSLDDRSCEAVIGRIKEVAQETQATLVISTHDSRVKAHFKHVIALGDGQ